MHRRVDAQRCVAAAESTYAAAQRFDAWREYPRAQELYGFAIERWDEYARSAQRLRHPVTFSRSDASAAAADCRLLDSLSGFIAHVNDIAAWLPKTSEEFLSRDKYAVKDTLVRYRSAVLDVIERRLGSSARLHGLFDTTLAHFDAVKSFFSDVYEEERATLELKGKFRYNQALSDLPRDSSKLRAFIADCRYYKSENQWCGMAHDLLYPPPPVSEIAAAKSGPASAKRAGKAADPAVVREQEFTEAMSSRRVDLLESYLARYGRSRKPDPAAKTDIVASALAQRKNEIEDERMYNAYHPPFSKAEPSRLRFTISGIAADMQADFALCLDSVRPGLCAIPGLRFPAGVSARYDTKPAMIMLDAYFSTRYDPATPADPALLPVPSVQDAMRLLSRYRCFATASIIRYLQRQGASEPDIKKQAESLQSALCVVRLWKDTANYITWYAKSAADSSASPDCRIPAAEPYGFFDITVDSYRDVRIDQSPARFSINMPQNPDSASAAPGGRFWMIARFFEK
jgi:alkanesulfonate monooxygenase SsuD/methylene tetrahydromethanopterin reductase-like flavin-dependent oxidoreductase (luciferase family)